MRIGVDARELQHGIRTGIGRMLEAVIAEAPKIHPDLRLFLYADTTTRIESSTDGVEYRLLAQPVTSWFDQVELPRALADQNIDVFWSPYYKAPLSSPCPTVTTIHDLLFLRVGGRRLEKTLFQIWARLMSSRSSAVLTDSEHSRRDILDILRLDPSLVEVIPLGVSEQFSPRAKREAPALLERLGIPKRYILTVTNFRPHKNDRTLVRAFHRLVARDPDVALVLAGPAAAPLDGLREMIDRMKLREKVFLPGLIADTDLPALYAAARLFAFPSLYEGFGLPVLEAMACGVPVICSSSSSLPEVLGESGRLLDPNDEQAWSDTIYELLQNERCRRQCVQSGLERASRFSWSRSVSLLLDVLQRVSRSK